MIDNFVALIICTVLGLIIGFGVGIEHHKLNQLEVEQKQICIQAYRENSAAVLADSFCDDYFQVMRESKCLNNTNSEK